MNKSKTMNRADEDDTGSSSSARKRQKLDDNDDVVCSPLEQYSSDLDEILHLKTSCMKTVCTTKGHERAKKHLLERISDNEFLAMYAMKRCWEVWNHLSTRLRCDLHMLLFAAEESPNYVYGEPRGWLKLFSEDNRHLVMDGKTLLFLTTHCSIFEPFACVDENLVEADQEYFWKLLDARLLHVSNLAMCREHDFSNEDVDQLLVERYSGVLKFREYTYDVLFKCAKTYGAATMYILHCPLTHPKALDTFLELLAETEFKMHISCPLVKFQDVFRFFSLAIIPMDCLYCLADNQLKLFLKLLYPVKERELTRHRWFSMKSDVLVKNIANWV